MTTAHVTQAYFRISPPPRDAYVYFGGRVQKKPPGFLSWPMSAHTYARDVHVRDGEDGGSRGRGRGRGCRCRRDRWLRRSFPWPCGGMQNVINTVKGKALEVAEYLTPVLKVPACAEIPTCSLARRSGRGEGWPKWPPSL